MIRTRAALRMPGFQFETWDLGTHPSCHDGRTKQDCFDYGEFEFAERVGQHDLPVLVALGAANPHGRRKSGLYGMSNINGVGHAMYA